MFIPDPDYLFIPYLGTRISDPRSRIPHPTSVTKEEGKKFLPSLVATGITKIENYFF
jgi:hypothetical protein